MKLLKGKHLHPDLLVADQLSFFDGALGSRQASIGDGGEKKVKGMWLLWECYSPSRNITCHDRGPHYGEDAGIMGVSDPS